MTATEIIDKTSQWVEEFVIGLNLCPFAKKPYEAGLIRYVASEAQTQEQLIYELAQEMQLLISVDPGEIETTLVIHPLVLSDFQDYNDFSEVVDDLIEETGLEGEIQAATFHPDYQFGGQSPMILKIIPIAPLIRCFICSGRKALKLL